MNAIVVLVVLFVLGAAAHNAYRELGYLTLAARRDAERIAPDAPLEINRGTVVRPLRLVLHERDEQLVDAAMRRHPAGSRRSQLSPDRGQGMATPGAAVDADAPGVVSKS